MLYHLTIKETLIKYLKIINNFQDVLTDRKKSEPSYPLLKKLLLPIRSFLLRGKFSSISCKSELEPLSMTSAIDDVFSTECSTFFNRLEKSGKYILISYY